LTSDLVYSILKPKFLISQRFGLSVLFFFFLFIHHFSLIGVIVVFISLFIFF